MYKQTNQTNSNGIASLKQEVALLRSLVISSLGRDKEGNYRPEFVDKVLKVSGEKAEYKFKGSKHFLKQLAE